MNKKGYYWARCPRCGNAKMTLFRNDTRAENLPCYCKKCKTESLMKIEPKSQIAAS